MEPKDDSTIAMAEDTGCKYCSALKEVNDPEEGSCPYCADLKGETASAGLENCKYCAASETPGTDCQYCNRPEVAAEAGSDCQYCADIATRDQDCQYCGRGPDTKNPTTTDSEDFAGQALDAPAIPKPVLGEDPQGQITPMDDTTNNNLALEGQGEANLQVSPVDGLPAAPAINPAESVQVDQSKEAMQAIAQQIEQAPTVGGSGPGPQGAATALTTDDAALVAPAGTVVDGTSRPDSYGKDAPQSMGLAEDNAAPAPDLTAVLHEGLDSHAENIQRERVVQMVSQALTGFKACKKVIEASQQQAPQLYQSSIMMLKAMIEMAKMLGFQETTATPTGNPLEGPGSEWQDPFPKHPDNGGAPQPAQALPTEGGATSQGDANSGNEWQDPFPKHPENGGTPGGTIGQPIGKLPTSATTEHVARTPLPPGAINAQGQKKYVDPETGKESFINMKEGRVLSPTGKPVKPPQQG
jgi:hypothetical protein